MRLQGLEQKLAHALTGVSRTTRLLAGTCILLSAVIVWGFRYPAGIDLPQHAHLFSVLAHFYDPALGAAAFFDLQPITPYLLTYAVGAALTKLFGPLVAVKCLLFSIALFTPYALWRWLRAVGAEKSFAYWGFALAFGYPYVWGFTSFAAALPVAFFCFEAWLRAPEGKPIRRALILGTLLVTLFFTHAITFAIVATSLGLSTLASFRIAFAVRASALGAAGLLSLAWFLVRGVDRNAPPTSMPTEERFVLLFGGEFDLSGVYWAGLLGFCVFVLLILVTRPTLSGRTERWLPLALAGLGFFALPNKVMSTAFVGQRFLFLVHAFAPAALVVRPHAAVRPFVPLFNGALTIAFLGFCLLRVSGLNDELRGLERLAAQVPVGGDVRGLMEPGAKASQWFGPGHLSCAYAWVTAERLGMLENDHGRYHQMPVVRSPAVHFLSRYRYLVTRGGEAKSTLRKNGIKGRLLFEENGWALYEDPSAPPLETPVGRIVRAGQDWGQVRVNESAAGDQLRVAGRRYKKGLGTLAHSLIQLHPKATGRLSGACGVDDAAATTEKVACEVLDYRARVLHRGVTGRGEPPARFEVPVEKGQSIFLKVVLESWQGGKRPAGDTHVDWVDLRIRK